MPTVVNKTSTIDSFTNFIEKLVRRLADFQLKIYLIYLLYQHDKKKTRYVE